MSINRSFLAIIRRNMRNSRLNHVFMSVSLAIAVLLMSSILSVLSAYDENMIRMYGKQHGFLIASGDDTAKTLSADPAVVGLGITTLYGYVTPEHAGGKYLISVGSMDDEALDLSRIQLLSGRLPKAKDEVAIERTEFVRLGIKEKNGAGITLSVAFLTTDAEEMQTRDMTLTIVGVVRDYSYMQYHPNGVENDILKLPGIIVSDDFHENFEGEMITTEIVSVLLSAESDHVRFFRDFVADNGLSVGNYYLNMSVYSSDTKLPDGYEVPKDAQGFDFRQIMYILSAVVIISIISAVIASQIALNNKMHFMVRNLKLAGAGADHILRFSLLRSVFSMSVIIPAGLILGLILSEVFALFILPSLIENYTLVISAVPLLTTVSLFMLIAVAVSLLSVYSRYNRRPFETARINDDTTEQNTAIRKSTDEGKAYKISRLEKRPLLLWAIRSFQSNRVAITGVVMTLTLSFSSLLFASYLISRMEEFYSFDFGCDYLLQRKEAMSLSSSSILETRFIAGFDPNTLEELRDSRIVEKFYPVSRVSLIYIAKEDSEEVRHAQSLDWIDTENGELRYERIHEEKKILGYSDEDHIFLTGVKGTELSNILKLEPYIVDGEISETELVNGLAVILLAKTRESSIRAGDELKLSQIITVNSFSEELIDPKPYDDFARTDITVRVCAVAVIPESDTFTSKAFGGLGLVWGENASSERLGVDWAPSEVYLDVKEEGVEIDDMIIRLSMIYPRLGVVSRSQRDKAVENERHVLMTIIYGVYAILVLFSIFSIFSFYRTLVYRNAGLYGALRASGFSRDLMQKIKLLESTVIVMMTFLFGNILGFIISFAFFAYSSEINAARLKFMIVNYPLAEVLIGCTVLIVFIFLAAVLPVRELYKRSIYSLLQN